MEKLLNALFPQGYRKLLVSLIALIVGVVLDKFGGGLDDNMRSSLIAIVAIFVTGNVGEHLADALKFLKGTKVGQIVEDIIPGDQGLGKSIAQPAIAAVSDSSTTSPINGLEAISKKLEEMDKKVQMVLEGPPEEPVDPMEEVHAKIDEINNVHAARVDEMEKKLAVQATNLGQIVQILNQLRAPQQGAK